MVSSQEVSTMPLAISFHTVPLASAGDSKIATHWQESIFSPWATRGPHAPPTGLRHWYVVIPMDLLHQKIDVNIEST
jgi:hypothetical protein